MEAPYYVSCLTPKNMWYMELTQLYSAIEIDNSYLAYFYSSNGNEKHTRRRGVFLLPNSIIPPFLYVCHICEWVCNLCNQVEKRFIILIEITLIFVAMLVNQMYSNLYILSFKGYGFTWKCQTKGKTINKAIVSEKDIK